MTADDVARADAMASARAVYDHSATTFASAVGTTVSARFETALDLAVLDAFATAVLARGGGPVLDAGCGTGRVTAYLAARGLAVSGVDLSPRMVEIARSAHPRLRFDVGTLAALPVADATLAAVVCWYAIIATPPDRLHVVWRELDRVLTSDGTALLAFQAGTGQAVTTQDAHGSGHALTLYRHAPEQVADTLHEAGLAVRVRVLREPELAHETEPQAIVVVGRPHGERPSARG